MSEDAATVATTTRELGQPAAPLVAAGHLLGRAMLRARGVPPVGVVPAGSASPEPSTPLVAASASAALWAAGRRRTEALTGAARTATADSSLDSATARVLAPLVGPGEAPAALLDLSAPPELLLALGSDERAVPRDGRTSYGMPLHEPAPLARLSSCTATPPDLAALAVTEAWRRQTLDRTLETGEVPWQSLRDDVVDRLCLRLGLDPGLWRDRVVLSPSGTDVESLASAFALAPGAPVLNVLVGSREAGSGTRVAAAGRWFAELAPLGRAPGEPGRGEPIAGFPEDALDVVDVEVRDPDGTPRTPSAVEAELDRYVEDALARGWRVLVHVLEGSKTELRLPRTSWVSRWHARRPEGLRVVVDAAQARISGARVRSYLDSGASVMITGSKSLSAPPFCAALILDDHLARDAAVTTLPAGLVASVAAADLPSGLVGAGPGLEPGNLGLLARWQVALAEWERRDTHDRYLYREVTRAVLDAVRDRVGALPRVRVDPARLQGRSILPISVLGPDGAPLGKAALADVYVAVVRHPGVQLGQPVELVRDGPAVLRAAVGAATVNRLIAEGDVPGGAARTADALAEALGDSAGR